MKYATALFCALLVFAACSQNETSEVPPPEEGTTQGPQWYHPSPSPHPSATATQPGSGPTYDGCPVFPASDSAYNANIANAPVDSNSGSYIAGLGSNASWSNDTIEYLNTANNSTPVLGVSSKEPWHSMPPEPWLSSFRIEQVSDAHSFVLQKDSCHIYELYETTYSNGKLSAYSGGDWNLTKPYVVRNPGSSGPNATGTSMFAGAVKYPELASGAVNHALLLIVPYDMLAQWQFVSPATSTDGIPYKGPGPMAMPYGAKLRLRADFPITGFGTQAKAVVKALQTYGAIVSDTGCCYKLTYMHDLASSDAFNFSDLNQIKPRPSDWAVIHLPAVQRVPGH
ncbi:MAG TPA: hypothetical protein VGF86_13820 [Candidatus Tumulicola sp.]|jgi:hypothetical protein